LQGERLKGEVFEYLEEYVTDLLEKHYDNAEIELIHDSLLQNLLVDFKIDTDKYHTLGLEGLRNQILDVAKEFYKRKEEMLGHELMARLERYAVLSVLDEKWKEHLREMDDLKEGIGLRAYGQKDPLIEYKAEGFQLFLQLLENIRNDVVSFCFKFFPAEPEEVQERKKRPQQRITTIKDSVANMGFQGNRQETDEGGRRGKPQQVVREEEKVGRNDPCPCGSGKKYKHCHGKVS